MIKQVLMVWMFLAPGVWAADFHGKVVDDTQTPVRGAIVTLTTSSTNLGVSSAISTMATSAADGTYTVPGLPTGSYVVCATPQGTGLLDSCNWAAAQPIVQMGTTTAPATTTQLQHGAVISIRVDDLLGLLLAPFTGGQVTNLSMGVTTGTGTGRFHAAYRASSDSTGHNFTLTVPASTALNFVVRTQNFVVKDLTGAVVSNSSPTALNLGLGATQMLHYVLSAP